MTDIKWIANLSNGETVPELAPIPGEKSSWQKLLKRVNDDPSISVTGLRLQYDGRIINTLNNKECDGYMHANQHRELLPGSYDSSGRRVQRLKGVGSIIKDTVFMTYIDIDTLNIYTEVLPLESCKVHTTLS